MRRLIVLSLLLVGVASAQVVPGVLRHASYEAPPDAGAWSTIELGSGTCTSVSDVGGTLTITAAGADIDNGCFVYRTIEASPTVLGAQIYGRISNISGTASATTKAGPMIANSGLNTAAHCAVRWSVSQSAVTGIYQIADGTSDIGGTFGQATNVPLHLGLSFVDSTNRCKMYEYDTATTPANPLTDFYGVPQPHTFFSIDMSGSFLVGFYVQSGHATNTAEVTITDYDVGTAVTLVDNYTSPRDVWWSSDWESGGIQAATVLNDGHFVRALRNDVDGLPIISTTGGCCAYDEDADTPNTDYDVQILKTATTVNTDEDTGGTTVSPIEGDFMAKHTIYSTKNYSVINGDPDGEVAGLKDKPRTYSSQTDGGGKKIPFFENYWIGFSVYIPSNYSYDRDDKQVQIMQVDSDYTGDMGFDILILDKCNAGTCGTTAKGNRWSLRIQTDDAHDGLNPNGIYYHIGETASSIDLVTDDAGLWTSFVINIQFDHRTPGNGFLKLWRSTGQKVSGECRGFPTNPQVNYTGEVGMTPSDGSVDATDGYIIRHPRVYKPGWLRDYPAGETPQAGPIEMFFDGLYVGPESDTIDGKTITTTFEDVNPCGLSVGSAVS